MRNKARTLSTAAVAALLLSVAVPALAQYGRPINEKEKEGLWRVGPLRLTPFVQLRNAGVDTNPFLVAASPSEETEVVLRGGLRPYVPVGRRLRLRGDGWIDFTFFSDASEPRAFHPGGELRAELDVGRFTFFGGGGSFSARQRYTTDIDTRIDRSEDWLHGGVGYQLTRIFGIDLGAESRRFRYLPESPDEESIKLLLDRDSLSYQGRLRYAITPLTTMLVSAEVVEDTFRFAEPSRATTRSYLYLGGFEFGQKAVLNGRLLAGVRDIPARSAGGVVPYTGPAVRGSLLVPILQQRVRIGADLTRDVYYSATALRAEDEPLRNTYTYGQWRLTLEFDLPVGFIGRVIAGWQDAEYHVPIVIDDVTMLREDRLRRLGGSLLRRLGRNARFGLTAVHSTRSSNVPGLAYTRWQYGVQAELTP